MTQRSRNSPKRSLPLARVYRLLEPGPVVLLTTAHRGRANVMTMSWHTMLEFEPPLVGCVVSNRNFSFGALRSAKECVINFPTVKLAEAVVKCGNVSGRLKDKFTALRSARRGSILRCRRRARSTIAGGASSWWRGGRSGYDPA